MSRRPIEPHGYTGGPLTPYIVLGVAWAALAAVWLAWAAGRLAAWVTGRPRTGPGFGADFVAALIRADWHALWPDVNPALVAVVYTLLLAPAGTVTFGGWTWWQAHRPRGDDPLPSLAEPRDVAPLTLPAVADKARRLRASLAHLPARRIAPDQAGVCLGAHHHHRRGGHGQRLYASLEDVLLAVMAPRAGKTTALTAPGTIAAPGAVIATSNKPDLWATTAAVRAWKGRVWVFDPQAITHEPQSWWWNPLAATRSWEEAHRLADHFVQQIRQSNHVSGEDFWIAAAQDLLTCFILAAACSGGTLAEVHSWLADVTAREPGRILAAHGFHAAARSVAGRQAGAPETRDGVYETARTAASCLSDPQIMAWVTPPTTPLPTLDVPGFPTGTDTLYLLSKDGAGSAAPLVAGLTDQLLRAAVRAAETHGGRLDPPMLAVLDEAANICKISDLPDLYSHFGSRGIVPMTILQSHPQGTRVWGEQGMAALWSAATIKLIGAGIDDPKLAEDLSRLVGDHDVPVGSATRDGTGHYSWQTSVRRQRILDAAQIRALGKGTALLLATGVKVAMIDLLPWYDGPDAAALTAAVDEATQRITTHARRTYGG
jgi:type IV secretory pathway TraG/TraD family ATPase VirD4